MIITTDNLSSYKKIFDNTDSSTLVIFDVDDVLFEPSDQILRGHYFKEALIFEHMIEEKYDNKTAEELYSIIWNERKVKVMEEETPLLIEHLQGRNIPVIALTNCMIGSYGLTKSVEDWRLGELTKCGYHLEKSWPNFAAKIFKLKDPAAGSSNWLYKQGAIFTNGLEKGKVLGEFLKHFDLKPQRIIFVDDLLKNLISVQDICTELNIDFTGIEYIKATSSYKWPKNLSIAKIQVQILTAERKWITDQEAEALLTNTTPHTDEKANFPARSFNIKAIGSNHRSLKTVIVYSIGNPTDEKIKEILKSYEQANRQLIGAFLSKKLVAVIGLEIKEKTVTVLHMSVLRELQKENIGTKLLAFVEDKFIGYKISLETDQDAVEFYQKFGFTCISFKNEHAKIRYKCCLYR